MKLLERDSELAALQAALADALAGRGRVVLIDGPAGIGKSGLLADLRARAADDLQVLYARAGELEREFAFGVVRQLLEGLVADPVRGPAALAGAAAPARAVFETVEADAAGEGASFAALHGLFWLTLNLSTERPLLLAVDDLHWCDAPSLRFLAYLIRRVEELPVLVVATLRSGEPGTDPALIAEIAGDPVTHPVRPGPLSSSAAAELVRERLGEHADAAFCTACHSATAGNPLLLRQLLRALEAERITPDAGHVDVVRSVGPRAASTTVLLRLARLPRGAADVARAVSVLGESAELPVIAELSGLGEAEVAVSTRALVQAELLRPEPPLGFVHPLVRDAVYHELAPGERALQHERAARALRDHGASPDALAAQLLHAPRRGERWVAELLHEAGRSAMRKGAAESAVTYLARALEEPPPPEQRAGLLLELGQAEALTHGPAAVDRLRAAHEELEDPAVRAQTALALGSVLLFTDRPDEAALVLRAAAAEVPPGLEDLRGLLEATELTATFFGAGDEESRARMAALHRPLADTSLGERAKAAAAVLDWAHHNGPAPLLAETALAALGEGDLMAISHGGSIGIAPIEVLVLADRPEGLQALDALLAQAHRSGSLFAATGAHLWRGFALYCRGDLAAAHSHLVSAREANDLWGFGEVADTYVRAVHAAILVERGEAAAAQRALGPEPRVHEHHDGARFWLLARLALLVAEGSSEAAVRVAEGIDRRFPWVVNPAFSPWRSYAAEALARLGRSEEALALAAEELRLARAWGAPGALGRALRVLGTLEDTAGIPRLEEAVRVLGGSIAALERAKALAALGAGLRHARRPADAREPLRRALELAAACDAPGLADRVRAELYATGARPRTDALAGVAALTPSERRVVDLAAAGDTNRDIAQALYVTPKTVEVHLSNAYRKLGVRSRRELPRALSSA